MRTLIVCCALMTFLYPWQAWAEEPEPAEAANNGIEFFLGGTHSEDDDTEFSVGIAYERRLSEKIGLGGLAEHTKSREWVLAIPFYFHPTEPWKLFLAPGVEIEDSESDFLVRVGTAYEFDMGSWTLAPELSFDFVDSEVKTIFGLNFGIEF
jgi:hypothetical protein